MPIQGDLTLMNWAWLTMENGQTYKAGSEAVIKLQHSGNTEPRAARLGRMGENGGQSGRLGCLICPMGV